MGFSDNNIIFLFSMPRSGSTLLQRILASHPEVITTSESWLLLPQLYLFEAGNSSFSEYDYNTCLRAIKDFCSATDGGVDTYRKAVAQFVTDAFYRATGCDDNLLFLEKTPRNSLIINQVFELFPNSKVIFLWRDPIAVASSIVQTFGRGAWKLRYYEIDLYKGLSNMIAAYEAHRDSVISIRYEDLIQKPVEACTNIFDYLHLPFEKELISTFIDTNLSGSVGDQWATYKEISREPLQKWQTTINNPLRKRWAKNYLNWIGEERLELMGYSFSELHLNLAQTPISLNNLGTDLLRTAYISTNTLFELDILKEKLRRLFRGERYYGYR